MTDLVADWQDGSHDRVIRLLSRESLHGRGGILSAALGKIDASFISIGKSRENIPYP